jgi:hypothetical protein
VEEKVDHRQLGDTLAPVKDNAARFLLPREPNQHVLQAFGLASFGFIKQVVSEPLAVGWNVLPAVHVRHSPPLQHLISLERRGTPSARVSVPHRRWC